MPSAAPTSPTWPSSPRRAPSSCAGAPIINQPQVAILGVGTIEKRPKVITLPDRTDTIAVRVMGMISMSYDHRVVDGADADRFLADVKKTLQEFPEGAV